MLKLDDLTSCFLFPILIALERTCRFLISYFRDEIRMSGLDLNIQIVLQNSAIELLLSFISKEKKENIILH